ncbi:MAG: DUF2259 domain-containing protein, partial [Deltaproteobacteria bacterium]|nr:DUF2259 domain-containing protein [Deltaproteobacteria bacterium]
NVGFSRDGTVYVYWTYGVFDGSGFSHAELNVVSTLTGRRNEAESRQLILEEASEPKAALQRLKAQEARRLKALGFGQDPGTELYRSGTATRTSFTVDGRAARLIVDVHKGQLDPETNTAQDRIRVILEMGAGRQTLHVGSGGWGFSLNSVRLSADHRSLAVLLRHSTRGFEGPNRRFLCTAGRLPR